MIRAEEESKSIAGLGFSIWDIYLCSRVGSSNIQASGGHYNPYLVPRVSL